MLGAAALLYVLFNKVLRMQIKIIPLLLCVACSLFVSMALPKVIVRYSDWLGALAMLTLFSLIFSYFLAYYDEKYEHSQSPDSDLFPRETATNPAQNEVPTGMVAQKHESTTKKAVPIVGKTAVPSAGQLQPEAPLLPIAPADTTNTGVDAIMDCFVAGSADQLPELAFSPAEPDRIGGAEQGFVPVVQKVESAVSAIDNLPASDEQTHATVAAIDATTAVSDPDNFDEQLDLAFRLKEQQKYLAAAQLFQKVLDANPHSEAAPLVLLQIADSLKQAKEYQQAIALLSDRLHDAAIEGNPGVEKQIHELLSAIQRLQDFEKTGGSKL